MANGERIWLLTNNGAWVLCILPRPCKMVEGTGGRIMRTMIDADRAIELLEALYRDSFDLDSIRHNIGVGAAISEIRHLKEEAEPKWLCDYVREQEKAINQFILDWFEIQVGVGEEFIRRTYHDKDENLYFDSIENGLVIFKLDSGAFTSFTPQELKGTLYKKVGNNLYSFL